MRLARIFCCCFLVAVSVVLVGCGPKFGEVTGTVTVDGTPVPGAEVHFIPIDPADPLDAGEGFGFADADGTYIVKFPGNKMGVPVGEYKVWISNGEVDFEGEEGEEAPVAALPIPKKYNQENSTLTATIVSGNNPLDWELTTTEE